MIFKTYSAKELPDNFLEQDIVEAIQIVDDVPVKIEPQQVKVTGAAQTIKLNLSIAIPQTKTDDK